MIHYQFPQYFIIVLLTDPSAARESLSIEGTGYRNNTVKVTSLLLFMAIGQKKYSEKLTT